MKQYERETKGLQEAKNLIRSRVSNAKSLLLKGKETARDCTAKQSRVFFAKIS
jgi:hypothetical protein